MFESVLVPHGNQSKIIRGIQDRLSGAVRVFAPFEPFFVRFRGPVSLASATAARAESVGCAGARVLVHCRVWVGGDCFSGDLLVGFLVGTADSDRKKMEGLCFSELPFDFPVFKIAEVVFEERDFSVRWRVLGETWKKIR